MKLRKTLQNLCLILAISSSTSCSPLRITNCLESSPLSTLESQIKKITEDPEIKTFYRHYFPNGKLEFSYEGKDESKTQTRTFVQPNINLNQGLKYNISTGIEKKY